MCRCQDIVKLVKYVCYAFSGDNAFYGCDV